MYTLTGLYLLVPVISPWLRQATKREIEFYLLLWCVTLLYSYLGIALKIQTDSTGILYYFTGYAGYFLLGYYLRHWQPSLKWLLPLGILMLPLPLFNKILGWDLDFYSAFWYLSAPVAIMTAAWFCALRRIAERRQWVDRIARPLTTISNLSFGIYLIHILIMRYWLWNMEFITAIGNYYMQTTVVIVLTFAISAAACWLIAKLPFAHYVIGYRS